MAQTPVAARTPRFLALFASSVVAFLAFASSAFAVGSITTPSGTQLPQGQTSATANTAYSASLATDCGSPALAGTWTFSGAASTPNGPAGLTISGSNSSNGSIGGSITAGQKVQNYSVPVRFVPSASNANCTSGTAINKTFTLPVLFKYGASAFGAMPSGVLAFNGSTAGSAQVFVSSISDSRVTQITSAATNPPNPAGTVNLFSSRFGTLNGADGLGGIGLGASPGTNPTRLFVGNSKSSGTSALSFTGNPPAAGTGSQADLTDCRTPAGISASDDDGNVFVACPQSGQVFQILTPASSPTVGTAPLTLPGTFPAPAGVARIRARKSSGQNAGQTMVVVGDAQNDVIYLLQPGTQGPTVVQTLPMTSPNAGCIPANIAAPTPTGTPPSAIVLYVACPGLGKVLPIIVDHSGNTPVLSFGALISVGGRPYGVAVTPDGTQLVVTDSADGTARTMTVNTTTGVAGTQVTTTLGAAGTALPSGVGIIAATPNLAYIANEGDGSMWVMDPPKAAKKKAKATRKHRARRKSRAHRKHHRRKAARAAQARNIALVRSRAHTLPLTPPLDG